MLRARHGRRIRREPRLLDSRAAHFAASVRPALDACEGLHDARIAGLEVGKDGGVVLATRGDLCLIENVRLGVGGTRQGLPVPGNSGIGSSDTPHLAFETNPLFLETRLGTLGIHPGEYIK